MALFDVNDERYRALWSAAETGNEHATTAFWSYLFRRDPLFRGDDWNVIPEAPPSDPSSKRRVDLKLTKWMYGKWHTVFFFEGKKGTAGVPEIQEVEDQALTACQAWLVDNRAHEMIHAKLWYTTLEVDYLLPMVPPTGDIADKSTYISAASSEAYFLRHGFETIIKNPAGLPSAEVAILKSNSTPPKSLAGTQTYTDFGSMSPTPSGSTYPQSGGMDSADGGYEGGYNVPMSSGYDVPTSGGYNVSMSSEYVVPTNSGYNASTSSGYNVSMSSEYVVPTSSGYNAPISSGYNVFMSSGYNMPTSSGYNAPMSSGSTTEQVASLPDDAQHVEVRLQIEENRYIYRYEYDHKVREAGLTEWEKRTRIDNGRVSECYLNTRENGPKFWTETLDPDSVKKYVKTGESRRSKGKDPKGKDSRGHDSKGKPSHRR